MIMNSNTHNPKLHPIIDKILRDKGSLEADHPTTLVVVMQISVTLLVAI